VWTIHHPGDALKLVDKTDCVRKNASGTASTIELLVQSCFQYLPESLLAPLIAKMPGERMNQMRENQKIVHGLARDWIADKSRALEVGEGHRDIMTLLGEYHYLCQVLGTLTVLQSRRTTPKTQRRDSLNTR
jgi:hypothetical protein